MAQNQEKRLEHVSSVENGMFMDNNPRFLPKGTYYYSVDGQIIDNGDNNYTWRNINGNQLSFSLPDSGHKPIGFVVLREVLVIFSKGTFDQISVVELTNAGVGTTATSIAFYAAPSLNFDYDYMIEGVASPETSLYQRIYWVDDRNQPRTLNLSAINFVVTLGLIAGQQYTVVSGSIITNQLGIPTTISAANTFTAEIATFTGTGLVIEYINPSMLNFVPSYTVAEVYFNRFILGNLMSGGYFVAAQFESNTGIISDWGIITDCIPVYKDVGPGAIVYYQKAPGHNAVTVPIQTGHGIRMTVRNIDTNFTKMRLAVFYSDDLNVIQSGFVLGDVSITATEMTYDIVDYSGLPITIEELLLKGPTIEKAGTIAIIKNQLVIGRLTEEVNVTSNTLIAAPTEKALYELPCDNRVHHHGYMSDNPQGQVGHYGFDVDTGGVTTGYIYIGQWYRVDGTAGSQITYEGTAYTLGSYFLGVTSLTGHHFTVDAGIPVIIPVIRISEYTDATGTTHYKYYDINASWLDYKNPLVCQLIKGFWGGEQYRIGLLPISLTNKPLRVIWLEDIDIPYRNNKNIATPNYPLMQGHKLEAGDIYGIYYYFWNINVMSLLYNLDISDFVDGSGNALIKGFSIVAAPLDKKIISDVFFTHSVDIGSIGKYTDLVCAPASLVGHYLYDSAGAGSFTLQPIYSYLKYVYSPEFLFGMDSLPSATFTEELYLKYLDIFDAEVPLKHPPERIVDVLWTNPFPYIFKNGIDLEPIGGSSKHLMFQRFYKQSEDNTLYAGKEAESLIINNLNLEINELYTYTVYATSNIVTVINGSNSYYLDGANFDYLAQGAGERCNFIEIEDATLGIPYRVGVDVEIELDTKFKPTLHYGTIERVLVTPYGGTSDSAKENTTYRHLGHYLELTPTVIANANYGGGVYKLLDVQVFGQDAYVYPWDLSRLYAQWWTDGTEANLNTGDLKGRYLNHCICAPIQSTVNIALRRAGHVAKERYYDKLNGYYSPFGIYYDLSLVSTSWVLDRHLYEKAFSSKFLDQIFLPEYEGMDFSGEFNYRFRWSNVKIYGEEVDNYLVFGAFNFKDLDPAHGQLTNLRSKLGRLYYWQEDTIGYIPVGERALVSANTAQLVELGTGESFSRYDDALSIAGNMHQFSMVETNNSFIWCDWKRRNILYMGTGFSKVELNRILGIDRLLNTLSFNYRDRISPVNFDGIGGCYIEKENKAIISFCCNDHISIIENIGILINLDIKKVESVLSKGVALSANLGGFTLQYNPLSNIKQFVWDKLTYDLFDVDTTPYITFCVNPESIRESNVYDTCILTGNENFFSDVTYYDSTDTLTENVVSTTNVKLSRYYEYRNKKWLFSIPLIGGRRRFKDDYIFIKFVLNSTRSKIAQLVTLVTSFRKTK